ncbi:helix-turn-helix transcriptional regulator [Actinomadura fibrosa]|uniref:AAA family ATPase n=1 Tax=Actinomadura fibrosa TaxID=111802 RepID=A0ABW2XKE9_9ACTN|nr:LuxR family transcriptional regulator [Actinomadura fibrosa]
MERAKILEQLDDLLDRSAGGRGAIAAISGPTAMGKTTLLNAVVERAAAAGGTVLAATGSRHERDVAYGALAQLFQSIEPADLMHGADCLPATASSGRTSEPGSVSTQGMPLAVARRAHRVVGRLAADRPVLIAVDDIQHVDTATLSCLRYLAQRLPRLPLMLVFTHGVAVDEPTPRVLHDLLYQPSVQRFHLGPLSFDGVRELAESHTSGPVSERFVAEIYGLSAGNPLLVQAIIEEHRFRPALHEGSTWDEAAAHSDGMLELVVDSGEAANHEAADPGRAAARAGHELTTGHVFHQAVLACLHQLGPRALRLARCVAMLDGSAGPFLLSRLSEIDTELVERLLRVLTSIGVLDGPRFRRASVRRAVLAEMPHDEAVTLRRHAARLLHDVGAQPQAVAPHLLAAGPLREDWVPPVLRDAARQAIADGDVTAGARLLELAAECCSDEAQRSSVKVQYASVRWQRGPADSARHFQSLKDAVRAGTLTGTDAAQVAAGMLFHLDFDGASDVIDRLGEDDDTGTAAELLGLRVLMAASYPGLPDRPGHSLPDAAAPATSTSDLRARHALSLVLERGADKYAIAQAEQVLRSSRARPAEMLRSFPAALLTLCYTDRLEAAAEWYDRLMDEVEGCDSPAWKALMQSVGALVSLRRGRLGDAVRLAEAAHAVLDGPRWNVGSALTRAILVEAYTLMGDHRAAAAHLTGEAPPAVFLTRAGLHYLYARGRHHLATGNPNMALCDFLECGTLMRRWNIDTPALVPWRLGAVDAWLRLGDIEQATRLVEEQLPAPGNELARSRGMVLHGLAAVRTTAKQPAILQEALRLLEVSGARYETAAVLADLSRAYQRLGEKAKARTTARRAWRIAKSCQAEAMCQALLSSSSPRSVTAGRHAASRSAAAPADQDTFAKLSNSERRVAVLAAQGYTNREIADKLFITVSTVEQHLTRVYRKMDIRNREQLLEEAHADTSEAV